MKMPQDFRKIILKRMAELKWTPYRLAKACEGKGVDRQSVFQYLQGNRQAKSENLQVMFDALGLKVKKEAAKPKNGGAR